MQAVAAFQRVVRIRLIEKVIFVQRLEGSEGVSCAALLGKEHPSKGKSPCGDPEAGVSLVLRTGVSRVGGRR